MKSFHKKLQLGSLSLPSNILAAPLAGYTDQPYRQIGRLFAPVLFFCEMVKMEAVTRKIPATLDYLKYAQSEKPLGAQLCGSSVKLAKEAAKILEELGFDLIDFNCGCPVDKVIKDGSGSAMMKTPELIGDILAEMTAAVKIPVTLKIRKGWNEEQVNAVEIVQIAEKAGVQAVTVHGRTRMQAYRGKADWEIIRSCKQAVKKIKIIGNGDLFDAEAVFKMFETTGCDGVMLARGLIGQPWLLAEIAQYPNIRKRTVEEIKQTILKHFYLIRETQEPKKAYLDMRRMIGWYLKFCSAKTLKLAVYKATSADDILSLIENYGWDTVVDQKIEENKQTHANRIESCL